MDFAKESQPKYGHYPKKGGGGTPLQYYVEELFQSFWDPAILYHLTIYKPSSNMSVPTVGTVCFSDFS